MSGPVAQILGPTEAAAPEATGHGLVGQNTASVLVCGPAATDRRRTTMCGGGGGIMKMKAHETLISFPP